MTKHNKEDSETSIENILFEERLDQDPMFDEPTEFEAAHVQSLKDKLLHFSRFGNLLTLVLGESGTGKSYLLEQFMDNMDENVYVCHIEAQPLFSSEQLYERICTSIATDEIVDFPNDSDSFRTWLDGYGLLSESHIVAIDDAETLSEDVLQEICRISAYQQTLDVPKLQFMLFATHDLALSMDNVSSDILDESGIYVIDIPLLDDADASHWLKYCLHKSGYLASDEEIEDLLADSDGNLANLAMLASSYADEQLEEEHSEIEEEPEETVSVMGFWFAGLTVIVIGVLALFFYQKEISALLFPEEEPVQVVAAEPINVSADKPAENQTDDVTTSVTEPEQLATTTEEVPAASENTDSTTEVVAEPVVTNEQPTEETTTDDMAVSTDEPAVTNEEVVEQPETTEPVAETVVETTIETTIYSPMEQMLLDTDDSFYVVQIIGLSNPDSIAKVMADHANLELVVYRSLLNGKPWQIIVLPGFEKYSEAQQARANLPESLAEFKPWIKSQRKVKEEIRAANN